MTEGKWPDAWKLHYVPYEMVAARANEEQILTSNGSGRREGARLATLSVLGHDMVCDGASQTSESRRGRFFFGIGARDATPEPVAR